MKKIYFFCFCLTLLYAQNSIQENTDSLNLLDESPASQQDRDAMSVDSEIFEGFISFSEYGKNLYENPRGIGCNKCHGHKGEGSVIARYTHKGNVKTLSAPPINTLELSAFSAALNPHKLSVMPRYYLTPKEIQAIYFYVSE